MEDTLGKQSERFSERIRNDMRLPSLKFACISDSRAVPVHGARGFVGWGHSARRASSRSSEGMDS